MIAPEELDNIFFYLVAALLDPWSQSTRRVLMHA